MLRVQFLNLSDNWLTSRGLTALAHAFRACSRLATLTLSVNTLNPEGVAALALALPACARLATLDLSQCSIGDAGVIAVARAIERMPNVARVDLDMNWEVTRLSVLALARAVSLSPSIKEVSVSGQAQELEAALRGPRNAGLWEALALFGGAAALRSTVEGRRNPAKTFVGACGDRAVLRIVVGMLVGE